jgi:hypothetical protein
VSLNSQKITNLATPTASTDAATKGYVDAATQGLTWKPSVRAATTTSGTLASSFANGSVIDGVTLSTGDRILLKNQSTASENGIYVVNVSGAPTRATDADTGSELVSAAVFVSEGTTNGDTAWVCTTDSPITLGTTSLTFIQFGATVSYSGGAGIQIIGTTISLRLNSNGGLVSNAGAGTNEASINLGANPGLTISSNQLSVLLNPTNPALSLSGGLAVVVSGTGAITKGASGLAVQTDGTYLTVNGSNQLTVAAGAVGRKFVGTISGDGSTTTFTITHSLNTKDVIVSVRGTSSPYTDLMVNTDVTTNGVNTVQIGFATAPAIGVNFSVTVIG